MKIAGQGKFIIVAVLGMLLTVLSTQAFATKIKFTRHNLSSTSKYNIKATSETQICIFCHTPHNSDSTEAPLWNHNPTSETFDMASSTYLNPGDTYMDTQPTGISKKCLSCHDGTVAIGSVIRYSGGGEIQVTGATGGTGNTLGGTRSSPTWESTGDKGYIGKNLSRGHIISFKYTDALVNDLNGAGKYNQLAFKYNSDKSMLDKNKKMQCHTCHDPHEDKCNDTNKRVGNDPLWRFDCNNPPGSGNGSVCEKCHEGSFGYYTAPNYPF